MKLNFVIAVWGDKFISQMCDVCLPCFLASRNLPAIAEAERGKFVLVTRIADLPRLKSDPIIQKVQQLIEVEFLTFDPAQYSSPHLALSGAHRMALKRAADEGAYFVLLDPDLVFSNGTLLSARNSAAAGKTVVMCSGLRLASEKVLPALERLNIKETYFDLPLLEPRNLMKFAMETFHPEVYRYRTDSQEFTRWPMLCLWSLGDKGLMDRSFHLHPLLLDMTKADPLALDTLDYDTIDGAYVWKAFHDWSTIQVEQDSDNVLVFSLSSMHECIEPPGENHFSLSLLRATAYRVNINELHRSYFNYPIRLHTEDLDSSWQEIEAQTAHLPAAVRSSTMETYHRLLSPHVREKIDRVRYGIRHRYRVGAQLTRMLVTQPSQAVPHAIQIASRRASRLATIASCAGRMLIGRGGRKTSDH